MPTSQAAPRRHSEKISAISFIALASKRNSVAEGAQALGCATSGTRMADVHNGWAVGGLDGGAATCERYDAMKETRTRPEEALARTEQLRQVEVKRAELHRDAADEAHGRAHEMAERLREALERPGLTDEERAEMEKEYLRACRHRAWAKQIGESARWCAGELAGM